MPSEAATSSRVLKQVKARAAEPADRAPETIDVWYWPLDIDAAGLDETVISSDERARADRLHSDLHRSAFVAARSGLRTVLSGYVGVPAEALVFSTGPFGKPALVGNVDDAKDHRPKRTTPHFNLSHAGGFAALAVCRSLPVGIDIEQPRLVSRNLPQRFFSAEEAAQLDRLPEGPAWEDAFFRIWTRKEAVLKALGTGLSLDTRSFTVSLSVTPPLRVLGLEPELELGSKAGPATHSDWQLLPLTPPSPAHLAAVAVHAPAPPTVVYRPWRQSAAIEAV